MSCHLLSVHLGDRRGCPVCSFIARQKRLVFTHPSDTSPMPSVDITQPHLRRDSSSEFHDRLIGLHDSGEPVVRQAPPDTMDPACPWTPVHPPDSPIHPSVDSPGWKRLINSPLTAHERTSLITAIFSNRDEIEMIGQLCRTDAQRFIDIVYEVRSHPLLLPTSDPTGFDSNFYILSGVG